MSPSRGGEAGPDAQAVSAAQAALRDILAGIHVLDVLPERSRTLAVDAELPWHTVIQTVLIEQHPQPQLQRSGRGAMGQSAQQGPGEDPGAAGGSQMRREAPGGADDLPPPVVCGIVSPSLPSNVLAEVCEFETGLSHSKPPPQGEDGVDEKQTALRRQWTSPDDGWGMHGSASPVQDLEKMEKMPMGTPVTVGELADFLACACEALPNGAEQPSQPARWAERVGGGDSTDGVSPACDSTSDILDWSLAQWRAHRLKTSGERKDPALPTSESASRLLLEERPSGESVLVHQVPLAPPRPILCTDDPEASVLKAVRLLLAYPELDALPIVSPLRCTVVAHLTLSYCLAYMLPRMRGNDLLPLATVAVGGMPEGGAPALQEFDSQAVEKEAWAERRGQQAQSKPVVLRRSQTLRDLLLFFARTPHSGVPIVEDAKTGGVVGLLSRRDLLNYLDIAMQSARRRTDAAAAGVAAGEVEAELDLSTPVEAILDTLRRFRNPAADEGTSTGVGATLLHERELTLKALPLRLLAAENRKLLFVQEAGGDKAPRLLRIVSASDVWRLLLGEQERIQASNGEDRLVEQEV